MGIVVATCIVIWGSGPPGAYAGDLEPPKGAVDETGQPRLAHVDVHPGGRGHTHLDLRYLIHGGTADPDPPEGESQQIGWFTWDAAIDRADPGLRGILEFLRS